MTLAKQIIEDIKRDEGYSGAPYHCPAGKLTIGWGCNIEDNPLPPGFQEFLDRNGFITQAMAEALMQRRLEIAISDCHRLFRDFPELPGTIRRVLVNMAYNLGGRGLSGFAKMRAAVDGRDWKGMAREMKDSKWYGQVGRRSRRLVYLVQLYAIKEADPGTTPTCCIAR